MSEFENLINAELLETFKNEQDKELAPKAHTHTASDITDLQTIKGDKGDTGAKGDAGRGISSIKRITSNTGSGAANTIRVTYTDNTTQDFTIYNGAQGAAGTNGTKGVSITKATQTTTSSADGGSNVTTFYDGNNNSVGSITVKNGSKGSKGDKGDAGKGITSIQKITSNTGSGAANTIRVTFTDNTTQDFTVYNGGQGTAGTSAAWFTGTAMSGTGTKSVSVSGAKSGDMYLNTSTYDVYKASSASSWTYQCNIKGAQGNNGNNGGTGATGNGISSVEIRYATSTSNTTAPSTWYTSVQSASAGSYLWTRVRLYYTNGSYSDPYYTVARQGSNGSSVTGQRGSKWYTGTAMSGTSTTTGAYTWNDSEQKYVGDMYLNTSYGYMYKCTTAGTYTTAKWTYKGSIKGEDGEDGRNGYDSFPIELGSDYKVKIAIPRISPVNGIVDVALSPGLYWIKADYVDDGTSDMYNILKSSVNGEAYTSPYDIWSDTGYLVKLTADHKLMVLDSGEIDSVTGETMFLRTVANLLKPYLT